MKVRFEFLDGIRGISALWVVLYHSLLFNGYSTGHNIKWSNHFVLFFIQKATSIGHLAVSIFIVLSGFCLALPVVNNNMEIKGGFKRYISRRAKRLIPPYYVALLLSGLLILLFPLLQTPYNTAWDSKLPVSFWSVISHIGLFHNLKSSWIFKINGAHWSIATEWQIYWLFPFMLLFWRRTNVYISFIIFVLLALLLKKLIPMAKPEFIILFFMGVICCYLSFKKMTVNKLLIPLATTIFLAGLLAFALLHINGFVMILLTGITFSFLLYSLVSYTKSTEKPILILENKPLEFLGKISYSLYLIHGPLLAIMNLYLLKNFELTNDTRQWIIFIGVFILIIPVTTIFYNLVEKRFLNK
ncbi:MULTISPECIES: acyltransferase family protein [Chryseobacterium]|uniref:Acyltransferase n=2 Tax=Chryseobacterium cucumeris TaxID=1813611 RepID=A0ABX9XB96_9FLAO|nr:MULTISPECIES: acyltransferase [Chryseobacterium]MDH5034483.1 acyltransferase [Chryseobacterium cucumeris]ROH95345.1 acyltransferase [Chryseobacterium cucumeris]WFB67331.1 acyltransferase [Chryseobacterium sp. WX]WNI36504.1 acyltransferase [Chryseobacterium sp. SG20098]